MDADLDRLVTLAGERAASPAPLDRLRAAVLVAEELRAQGDELLDRFVAQARREQCSWAEIGGALGVTKQAAHQRFLSAEQSSEAWPPEATGAVRAAFAAGQADARRLGHDFVGTEHVLLGLLDGDGHGGVAARALAALGVDRAHVLARVTALVGAGPERDCEAMALAPRLKRALEIARAHARALGRPVFDTEHLLLAFVDIEDSVAARVLRDLGAPPEAVRERLAEVLGVDPEALPRRAGRRRLRRTRMRR